ncbi:transcriptional regulator with XRE-family HTH domain [Paenibacillus anaericanus]|uniref:helix-turn-helix transcriptional regulator n=1 Tax=Paenibacillus anaericanus TaxID=170367 RepID=UPI00278951DF|nr:helix-turn-helix transcriptional regulator [Paenibacillus anaericanus]MDQ0091618.1 transcriptional regulator with XRE-family HTH domain [Paenibacillus anaericanus]
MNKQLIDARKEMGLTISEASVEIGISYGMLAMLESKKRNGSDNTKVKVSSFYKKTVQELFYTH